MIERVEDEISEKASFKLRVKSVFMFSCGWIAVIIRKCVGHSPRTRLVRRQQLTNILSCAVKSSLAMQRSFLVLFNVFYCF